MNFMKQKTLTTITIGTIGVIGMASAHFTGKVAYEHGVEDGRKAGYNEGRETGYNNGWTDSRKKIASDLAELGVENPVRMISDHPSIEPQPVPYFFENEFKSQKQKKESK